MRSRFSTILLLVLFACVIAIVFTGCGCKHEWKDATCTSVMHCSLCDETQGEPLGHTWNEATCTAPKTCSVCKVTEGAALDHKIVEWKQTKAPTCSEVGIEEGKCENCDFSDTRDVATIAHTEGEWVITKAATVDAAGTKECSCTVCEKVVKRESFNLSAEELEQAYKDMQEMIVLDVRVDGVGFLNSNKVYVTVKNTSDKVVKEYIVGMLCFDKDGYPVVPQYEDSNLVYGRNTTNIQPCKTAGANGSWTQFSDTKLYVKACVKSVEYHDGTTWENPYFYYWVTQEQDRY